MQICKKRATDNDYNDDSSLNEDDNNDDSSSVNLFGTKFFMSSGSKSPNMQSWKDPNENR